MYLCGDQLIEQQDLIRMFDKAKNAKDLCFGCPLSPENR